MRMKKEVGVAAGLLLAWVAVGTLLWRFIFRSTVMSLESESSRSGLGIFTLIACQAVAYFVVNILYRCFGGKGSFLRWSLDELERLVTRKA